MNISSSINAAVLASGIKGGSKIVGKLATQSGKESPASDASDSAEKVEISGRALQKSSDSSVSVPTISNISEAESTTEFLKNVIFALPALVLRTQAHPMQESGSRASLA